MSIRHNRDLRYRKSRNNKIKRPKTFANEEAAKVYASANGIDKYTLRNLRSEEASVKKLIIVEK
jgi:hypothetical protein